MAAAFTESISGSANSFPGLNSASSTSTSICLLRSVEIEELRVCVIQSLQTLSLHPPTMPRCAQLADNSPSPSNTSYLSGDNWKLSGCSISPLQIIVIVGVIVLTSAQAKAGNRVKRNRRDALKLAHIHRSGDLAAVWIQAAQIRGAPESGAGTRSSRAGSTACAASAEQVSAAHRKWARTCRHCAVSRRLWR